MWFQGCRLRCRGCISQDTWHAATPADQVPVREVLDWIAGCGPVDGLTISGGEPFDQPAALSALIRGFRARFSAVVTGSGVPTDVLVYSGYSAARLHRVHPQLWRLPDAVVSGPYVAGRPGDARRGSGNQQVHTHSRLGQDRYGSGADPVGGLQVEVAGGAVWMIGIPREGDMARLEADLVTRGVHLSDVSWRC